MGLTEEAWWRLQRQSRTSEDIKQVGQAAVALPPAKIVLTGPELNVTFRWQTACYFLQDMVIVPGEPVQGASWFCLTPDMVHLAPRGAFKVAPSPLAQLQRAMTHAWQSPEHDLTRALLAVQVCAVCTAPISHRIPREEHLAAWCGSLNTILCRLAAARLSGPARAVAAALADTWTHSPLKLTATAAAVLQNPAETGRAVGDGAPGQRSCGLPRLIQEHKGRSR
jgi:hypothetical protein